MHFIDYALCFLLSSHGILIILMLSFLMESDSSHGVLSFFKNLSSLSFLPESFLDFYLQVCSFSLPSGLLNYPMLSNAFSISLSSSAPEFLFLFVF